MLGFRSRASNVRRTLRVSLPHLGEHDHHPEPRTGESEWRARPGALAMIVSVPDEFAGETAHVSEMGSL